MNPQEIITKLLSPKETISRCRKLLYVDKDVAEEAAKLIEKLLFWKGMTRDDACRAYADYAGQKDGKTIFTDKDCLWGDEYEYAQYMPDKELIGWLEENYV